MKIRPLVWRVRDGVWLVLLAVALGSACYRNNPSQVSQNQPAATTTQGASPMMSPHGGAMTSPHGAPSGGLTYQAPPEWISEPPSSSMRVAQYKLPRAEGDLEDASLVVYYFGPGQGGSVEANLARWTDQMAQPDGSPSSKKATTKKLTVNGMNATLLDVSGTYQPGMMAAQGDHADKPNFRLRAAVLETPGGNYFFKLVGPQKTVARWDGAFMKFVESTQFK